MMKELTKELVNIRQQHTQSYKLTRLRCKQVWLLGLQLQK